MAADANQDSGQTSPLGAFNTTHWSLVLLAGQGPSPESAGALEKLCRAYWYPLYAFARRSGLAQPDAQDATQGFFEHLLGKSLVGRADPQRGRFRSFLLTSFKNFLGQERIKAGAQKRGGGLPPISLDETVAEDRYRHEPADTQSPDRLFDRRWAVTIIETVLQKLETEQRAAGKATQFDAMKPFLTGDQGDGTYTELGAQLGLSQGAARVTLHRLRQRFHELFRAEVSQTVTSEADLEEELRQILAALRS